MLVLYLCNAQHTIHTLHIFFYYIPIYYHLHVLRQKDKYAYNLHNICKGSHCELQHIQLVHFMNNELSNRFANCVAFKLTHDLGWQLHITPVLPPVATLKNACVRYPCFLKFLISSELHVE